MKYSFRSNIAEVRTSLKEVIEAIKQVVRGLIRGGKYV